MNRVADDLDKSRRKKSKRLEGLRAQNDVGAIRNRRERKIWSGMIKSIISRRH